MTMMLPKKKMSEEWGLSDYFAGNRAIILNFYGKPGTGKSMAAEAEPDGNTADAGCELFSLHEGTLSAVIRGQKVELKAKEFKLLQCLYQNRGTIVTKQRLFDEVWGDAFFSDGTLNVHIRRLREKIEENPDEPKLIKTIWGTGYMMEI